MWVLSMKKCFVEKHSNIRIASSCSRIFTKSTIPTFKAINYRLYSSLLTFLKFLDNVVSDLYHQRSKSSRNNISIILLYRFYNLNGDFVIVWYPITYHFIYSFCSWSRKRCCSYIIGWMIWHLSIVCCYKITFFRVNTER